MIRLNKVTLAIGAVLVLGLGTRDADAAATIDACVNKTSGSLRIVQ